MGMRDFSAQRPGHGLSKRPSLVQEFADTQGVGFVRRRAAAVLGSAAARVVYMV
jgi:hypothetical protein